MTREVLEALTPGELERALYAYREISDVYEERFDGPRGACVYREYLVARQTIRTIGNMLNEIRSQIHEDRADY